MSKDTMTEKIIKKKRKEIYKEHELDVFKKRMKEEVYESEEYSIPPGLLKKRITQLVNNYDKRFFKFIAVLASGLMASWLTKSVDLIKPDSLPAFIVVFIFLFVFVLLYLGLLGLILRFFALTKYEIERRNSELEILLKAVNNNRVLVPMYANEKQKDYYISFLKEAVDGVLGSLVIWGLLRIFGIN